MSAALARTQWLESRVLSEALTRTANELPAPVLASTHVAGPVRQYLKWWITHPDPAGAFAARTRWLRRLPASWLPPLLFGFGYDGLLYLEDSTVIGHVFFQRRGPDLHAFSTAVSEGFSGTGYSLVMLLDFVSYGSRLAGITRARVGTGRNQVSRRLLDAVKTFEAALGWHAGDDGWVTFTRPEPRV